MQMPWIFSSTSLPNTSEPIDFLLEDRDEPMHGTFGNGSFHSRWADYSASRVQSWRSTSADLTATRMPPATTPSRTLIGAIKRFARLFPMRSDAAHVDVACARAQFTQSTHQLDVFNGRQETYPQQPDFVVGGTLDSSQARFPVAPGAARQRVEHAISRDRANGIRGSRRLTVSLRASSPDAFARSGIIRLRQTSIVGVQPLWSHTVEANCTIASITSRDASDGRVSWIGQERRNDTWKRRAILQHRIPELSFRCAAASWTCGSMGICRPFIRWSTQEHSDGSSLKCSRRAMRVMFAESH